MTGTPAADLLATACPALARLRAGLPRTSSPREVERAALTHALHCPVCRPLADRYRQQQAVRIAGLAEQACIEAAREAVPVLLNTAKIIEANGWTGHFLWDTRQHAAGTPLEFCRVDIVGALAIALHGSPTYAGTPAVRKVEELLVDRIPAPSLAAWYTHPGVGERQALTLLHRTADELRASCDVRLPQRQTRGAAV